MNKIIILNGPNLNLLGEREKNQYGSLTLEDIEKKCKEFASKNNIHLSLYQSNIEGELIEKIQDSRNIQHGLVINAGGYTHTSVAIHDALKILTMPIIELHMSNIYNREEFRHKSLISKVAKGIICGFGADGYIMALKAMVAGHDHRERLVAPQPRRDEVAVLAAAVQDVNLLVLSHGLLVRRDARRGLRCRCGHVAPLRLVLR